MGRVRKLGKEHLAGGGRAGVKKLEDMREAQRDHMLFWAAQISEKALLILII